MFESYIAKVFIWGGIGYLFLFIIVPITFFYICKKGAKSFKEYCKAEKQYHKEANRNNLNVNHNYIQVKQLFNKSMKSKLLQRKDILDFKDYIDCMLQKNIDHYKKFYFKNDCQEIYIKLKSSSFTDFDYKQLYDYLYKLIQK